MEKAYSKRRWRTIRKRERANERASEKREKETWWSQGFVSRAPVYLFLLLGCECLTHVGFSLSLSLGFSPLQAAAGKEENGEEKEEAEDAREVEGKKEEEEVEEGTREEKYGRNCRRSSSSADCRASMRQNKNGRSNSASMRKKRKKKNKKKWRNIKNTNKYATHTTRMKANDEKRRDLWKAHTYTAMLASAESRTTTTITTTTDDETAAAVNIAR